MKISTTSNGFDEFGEMNERYRNAAEMGFGAMDLDMEEWSVGQIFRGEAYGHFDKSLKELCDYYHGICDPAAKAGITVWQAHAPFPSMYPQDGKMCAYLPMVFDKCIRICGELHIPFLVAHPVSFGEHRSIEEDMRENIEVFARYIDALKESHVVMCIENTYDVFRGRPVSFAGSNAEFLVELVERLNDMAGTECFGTCYDVGHANITGKDQYSEIMKYGSHLKVLHIHDTDGTSDSHIIPYTGRFLERPSTDWDGVLKALAKINYQGTINFECVGGGIQKFPKEVRKDALRLVVSIGKYFDAQIESMRKKERV